MYCKIYLHFTDERSILLNILNSILNGIEIKSNTLICTNKLEVDALYNKEFDENKIKEFPDGFLFWKMMLEFHYEGENEDVFVENLSISLKSLWDKKIPAIATDFEEFLPENGGYKSIKIPWP